MEREPDKDRNLGLINRQAAEWLSKRQRGLSAEEQDEFFDWLARDDRHSERFAAHSRTWKRLDLLAQWRTEHSDVPNEDLLQVEPKSRVWGAWIGGIAALLVLGVFLFVERSSDQQVEVQGLIAKEFERHRLPDGSIVDLNEGSALKIEYSKRERRLELVASEGYFQVAKDPNRPFIVVAKGVEVMAIGTVFNVRIAEEQVEVLVTEGKVRLNSTSDFVKSLERTGAHFEDKLGQELSAGQLSIVRTTPSEFPLSVKAATVEDIKRIEGWRKTLEFDSVPLAEVVAEFNRRNDIRIVIDDAQLSSQPILATFHSDDSEQFVELLELMVDIEVERESDRIVLRRSRKGKAHQIRLIICVFPSSI